MLVRTELIVLNVHTDPILWSFPCLGVTTFTVFCDATGWSQFAGIYYKDKVLLQKLSPEGFLINDETPVSATIEKLKPEGYES